MAHVAEKDNGGRKPQIRNISHRCGKCRHVENLKIQDNRYVLTPINGYKIPENEEYREKITVKVEDTVNILCDKCEHKYAIILR